MKKEQLLYNVIFPEDEDPSYINYGYFIGRNRRSIYKLKATLNEGQLNPIIISDGNNENAFYAKVFQNEVERFLKIVAEFHFEQININCHSLNEVKLMFGEQVIYNRKKMYKSPQYNYSEKYTNGIKNWKIPYIIPSDPIKEHKPTLKRAI
ncbi:hypothetical protein K9O30_14125 [Clostridium bowmanii]|uniref:hypothetical protein n=1 Tax=Clostridium bowmanii TaxID=132925 RepID=UPI001C0D816A|nr:hypothetical protein [Clostridium bowmanii]MBU3190188.1 hypothetical protein [Clostridium bowmanii]MCA1074837.1 hypothetical protein [Clostridium bowmanii]